MDGVVATLPGFLDGREVVDVTFDPKVLSYDDLVMRAARADCVKPIFTRNDEQKRALLKFGGLENDARAEHNEDEIRPDKEPKYYLSRTNLRFVPMTPLQAARVNATVRAGDPAGYLAPSQIDLLRRIEAAPEAGWKSMIGVDFLEGFYKVKATLKQFR